MTEKNAFKSVINVGSDVTDVTFGWMFQVTLLDVGGHFARLDELNLYRLVSLRESDLRETSRVGSLLNTYDCRNAAATFKLEPQLSQKRQETIEKILKKCDKCQV